MWDPWNQVRTYGKFSRTVAPRGTSFRSFEGSSPVVILVQKFSWTEEFLQHMRALSTAAQFADPEVAATDTVDNIIILVNHPGDRLWPIFRPGPQDLRCFPFP